MYSIGLQKLPKKYRFMFSFWNAKYLPTRLFLNTGHTLHQSWRLFRKSENEKHKINLYKNLKLNLHMSLTHTVCVRLGHVRLETDPFYYIVKLWSHNPSLAAINTPNRPTLRMLKTYPFYPLPRFLSLLPPPPNSRVSQSYIYAQ